MVTSSSNNIKRAGLCVYDPKTKNIFCLKRLRPYTSESDPSFFIEQFSIPRGKCARHTESIRDCAIREFIEETGYYFRNIKIYDEIFQLYWNDPVYVRWEYSILFATADFKDFASPNLIKINKLADNDALMLARIKSKKYEHVSPRILKVTEYISAMRKRLRLYGQNNYMEFIELLARRVRNKVI